MPLKQEEASKVYLICTTWHTEGGILTSLAT